MSALEKLQQLKNNGELDYSWEFCVKGRGVTEPFYAYGCAGINMISTMRSTFEEAVAEALDMFQFVYETYNTHEIKRQDLSEKERVNIAWAVYEESPEEFKRILGLTKEEQENGTEYDDYHDA